MGSFVNEKTRVFKGLNDPSELPTRQRCEARLKNYRSATDARSWSNSDYENKKYIVELMGSECPKSAAIGKYVPIEVLVDTLMANKNSDIEKLKAKLEAVGKILSPEQQDAYNNILSQDVILGSMGDASSPFTTKRTVCVDTSCLDQIGKQRSDSTGGDSGALAEKAIVQLETLKDIVSERDALKNQLTESLKELKVLKKCACSSDNCEKEIKQMEVEIEKLRRAGTTDELEVINKELQLLKRYCQKLNAIKVDNERLHEENKKLKAISSTLSAQVATTSSVEKQKLGKLKEHHSKVVCICSKKNKMHDGNVKDDGTDSANYYKDQVAVLNQKLARLQEVTMERDQLQASVSRLETELKKFDGLQTEVAVYKRRSEMLEGYEKESKTLKQRLESTAGLEAELRALKKKAARADELERQFGGGLCKTASAQTADCDRQCHTELEMMRIERDRLKLRLNEVAMIEKEFKSMKDKVGSLEKIKSERKSLDADMQRDIAKLKEERDMHKSRASVVDDMQKEMDGLRAKSAQAQNLDAERTALLRRVRDLECVIADQESEINRLVAHVDRLSSGQEKQQDHMKGVISGLREDLEKKDNIISQSQEQIGLVQSQLKATIDDVTNETSNLRDAIVRSNARINELEGEIAKRQSIISVDTFTNVEPVDVVETGQSAIVETQTQVAQTTDSTLTDNDKLELMLQQTKNAAKTAAAELDKHSSCKSSSSRQQDVSSKVSSSLLLTATPRQQQGGGSSAGPKLCCQACKDLTDIIKKLKSQLMAAEQVHAENDALRRHSNEIQAVATDQIQDLVHELKGSRDKILNCQDELAMLKAQLAEQGDDKQCRASCRAEIEALRRQIQGITGTVAAVTAPDRSEVDDLKRQLAALKAKCADTTELDALRKQLAAAKAACEAQMEDLRRQYESNSKGQADLDELRRQLAEAQKPKGPSQADYDALQNKLNEALKGPSQADYDSLKSQLAEASKRPTQAQLDELQRELELAQKCCLALEDVKKQLAEALKPHGPSQADYDALKQQLDEALKPKFPTQSDYDELRSKCEAEKSKCATEADALRKQLQALQNELDDAKASLSAVKSQLEGCQKELAAAQAIAGEVDGLKKQLGDAKAAGDGQQSLISDLQRQLEAALKAANDTSELDALKKKLADAEAALAAKQKALDDLEKKLGDCESKNAQLESSLAAANKELAAAKASADSKQAEIDKLKGQLSDAAAALKSAKDGAAAELDALRKEIAGLKKEVGDLKSDCDKFKKGMEDAQKEADKYKKEVDKYKSEVDKYKSEVDEARKNAEKAKADLDAMRALGTGDEARDKERQDLLDMIKKLEGQLAAAEKHGGAAPQGVDKDYEKQIRDLEAALAKQKKDCAETIANMKAQYDRDIKNLHAKYNDGIEKLQASHEEMISVGNQELEREVDELRETARKSQITLQEPPSDQVCICGGDGKFRYLLKKCLKEGIETLVFDDLQFIHGKICDATARCICTNRAELVCPGPCGPCKLPPPPPPPPCGPSCGRTCGAPCEADLRKRQKMALGQVARLQLEVAMERQRLEDLKRTLEIERNTNNELGKQIRTQSKTVNNYMSALEHEQSKNRVLQCNLKKERSVAKELSGILINGGVEKSKCCCHKQSGTKYN